MVPPRSPLERWFPGTNTQCFITLYPCLRLIDTGHDSALISWPPAHASEIDQRSIWETRRICNFRSPCLSRREGLVDKPPTRPTRPAKDAVSGDPLNPQVCAKAVRFETQRQHTAFLGDSTLQHNMRTTSNFLRNTSSRSFDFFCHFSVHINVLQFQLEDLS